MAFFVELWLLPLGRVVSVDAESGSLHDPIKGLDSPVIPCMLFAIFWYPQIILTTYILDFCLRNSNFDTKLTHQLFEVRDTHLTRKVLVTP